MNVRSRKKVLDFMEVWSLIHSTVIDFIKFGAINFGKNFYGAY